MLTQAVKKRIDLRIKCLVERPLRVGEAVQIHHHCVWQLHTLVNIIDIALVHVHTYIRTYTYAF